MENVGFQWMYVVYVILVVIHCDLRFRLIIIRI
jgi:hypothetical protein